MRLFPWAQDNLDEALGPPAAAATAEDHSRTAQSLPPLVSGGGCPFRQSGMAAPAPEPSTAPEACAATEATTKAKANTTGGVEGAVSSYIMAEQGVVSMAPAPSGYPVGGIAPSPLQPAPTPSAGASSAAAAAAPMRTAVPTASSMPPAMQAATASLTAQQIAAFQAAYLQALAEQKVIHGQKQSQASAALPQQQLQARQAQQQQQHAQLLLLQRQQRQQQQQQQPETTEYQQIQQRNSVSSISLGGGGWDESAASYRGGKVRKGVETKLGGNSRGGQASMDMSVAAGSAMRLDADGRHGGGARRPPGGGSSISLGSDTWASSPRQHQKMARGMQGAPPQMHTGGAYFDAPAAGGAARYDNRAHLGSNITF